MENKMYLSLQAIKQKHYELESKLNDPKIISDINTYTKLTREINGINKIVQTFKKYLEFEQLLKDSQTILNQETDPELISFAKEEITLATKQLDKLTSELKILLLPQDKNDDKNVIIEIRGAAGGNEANIFARDLFSIYRKWAALNNMSISLINSSPSEGGGLALLVFKVSGYKAFSKLKFESGAHRVQRIPVTETQGRVHTSTATVTVMPEADETVDIDLKPADLKIDTFRSTGAGGQSVNTTDSAVRITHLPTGIVASSQEGKNQLSNKELALKTLKTRIYDLELKKLQAQTGAYRKLAGSGSRSEKIRTYNYPQDRVTDHRINFSMSLKSVLDGKIDVIIDALIAAEQAEKIKKIEQNY